MARTLIAAFALAVRLCAASAIAADVGSRADVGAIRHDLPILLARWELGAPAAVTAVHVDGNAAAAQWSAGATSGAATLHRRSDRWWLVSVDGPPAPAAPSPAPGWASSTDATDGFDATFAYSPPGDRALRFDGRAATVAEMPPAPGENGYYFFALSAGGAQRLDRATLDVWFPFVLDPNQRYVLWLGFVEPEVRALPGTLQHNVLHFALPPMSFVPGKTALGEIDGDTVPGLR